MGDARTIQLKGFENGLLNGSFTERRGADVFARETYWSRGGEYFIFWSNKQYRWVITTGEDLPDAQNGKLVYPVARSPCDIEILTDKNLSVGWEECLNTKWRRPPNAGVANITMINEEGEEVELQAANILTKGARSVDVVPTRVEYCMVHYTLALFILCLVLTLGVGLITSIILFSTGDLKYEVFDTRIWAARSSEAYQRLTAFGEVSGLLTAALTKDLDPRSTTEDTLTLVYEVREGDVFKEEYLKHMLNVENKLVSSTQWPEHCELEYAVSGGSVQSRCRGPSSVLEFAFANAAPLQAEELALYGQCADAKSTCTNPNNTLSIGRFPCNSKVFDPVTGSSSPQLATQFQQTRSFASHFREDLRCLCCAHASSSAGCSELQCPSAPSFCGDPIEQQQSSFRISAIGKDFSCASGASSLAKSRYYLGSKPGWKPSKTKDWHYEWTKKDLVNDLMEAASQVEADTDGKLKVYFYDQGQGMLQKQSELGILNDQLLAIGSCTVVLVWIGYLTGSIFLAFVAILSIVLAVPVAFTVWAMMGFKYLSALLLCVVFMTLGIGADDVFVLWDSFQQASVVFAKNKEDFGQEVETQRFAWALRRAFASMALTTGTTFASFIVTVCLSQIPAVIGFGIFGAIVVVLDLLLVLSLFATAVILYERYLYQIPGPYQCFGLFRKRVEDQLPDPSKMRRSTSSILDDAKLRRVEVFFYGVFSKTIYRFRYAIIVFWIMIIVAGLTLTLTCFRPSSERLEIFHRGDLKRTYDISRYSEGFIDDPKPKPVIVVFGVDKAKPLDLSGTNSMDGGDTGKIVFDQGSVDTLASPQGQLELYQMCEDARATGVGGRLYRDPDCQANEVAGMGRAFLSSSGQACKTGVSCFIDYVHDYRVHYLGTYNENNWATGDLNADLNINIPADLANQQSFAFYLFAVVPQLGKLKGPPTPTWNMKGGRLEYAFVMFDSDITNALLPLKESEPAYDAWEAFTSKHLKVNSGYQTSEPWFYMALLQALLNGSVSALGLYLGVAWILLCIASMNVITPCLCILSIVATLSAFFMFLMACGWSLGLNEALGIMCAAGLSVDYSVHITHSYNHCHSANGEPADRKFRTTRAFVEMGISIIAGCGTTVCAAIFLLFCALRAYFQFGVFIIAVVILSLCVALSLLPALLFVVGPEGNQGDISWIFTECLAYVQGITADEKGINQEDGQLNGRKVPTRANV